MVYAGFHDSRRDIPDPPPAQTAPDQHDEENMDARPESPDQEEMEQANNKFPACSGWGAREEGLQGIGSPAVTLAQDCTRVCLPLRSMSVQRLWRLDFSQLSTKIRPICSPSIVAPVPTRSGPQDTIQGYPGLSQFMW